MNVQVGKFLGTCFEPLRKEEWGFTLNDLNLLQTKDCVWSKLREISSAAKVIQISNSDKNLHKFEESFNNSKSIGTW